MKFSASHEWVLLEDNIARVGISKYAQKELGEIVHVELPKIGDCMEAGEEVVILESTKSAVDIYTPVSGVVVEVNEELKKRLDLLNQDPEGAGWLFKIEIKTRTELDSLLSLKQYLEVIGSS